MIQLEKLPPIQLRQSSRAFSPLLSDVQRMRQRYFEQLESFPPAIRNYAIDHYQKRVANAVDHVLLGELLPSMVAEWFGCNNSLVENVSGKWLLLYFSIIMLDDALDDPESFDYERSLVVSSLLQQRGICGLLASAKDQAKILNTIDFTFKEVALSAICELRSTNNELDCVPYDLIAMSGKKLSFARICVDAIADQLHAPEHDVIILQQILDDLLIAVQLLDDITDWEKDMLHCRATLPLSLLNRRQLRKTTISSNNTEMMIDLIKTGALQETLGKVLSLLNNCTDASNQCNNVWWSNYLTTLKQAVSETRNALRNARTDLLVAAPLDHAISPNNNQLEIIPSVLDVVRRNLETIAQSS